MIDDINMIDDNHNILSQGDTLFFNILTNRKSHKTKEAWVIVITSKDNAVKTCNIMTKLYTDVGTRDINFYYNQDIFNGGGLLPLINFFEKSDSDTSDDIDMPDADDIFTDMIVT
jgi:hypothetical protein